MQRLDVLLVVGAGGQPRPRAGAHHVGPHAVLAQLGGDGERQPVHPALACRITGATVVPEEGERTGVDDRAAALRDHPRRGGSAGLERRQQVGVEEVAELCGRHVQDRRARGFRRARAVHQGVDGAELRDARLDECIGDPCVGGGAGDTDCATADPGDRLGHGVAVAAVDHDAVAECAEEFGDGESHTAGPADDDCAGQPASCWPNVIASMFQ